MGIFDKLMNKSKNDLELRVSTRMQENTPKQYATTSLTSSFDLSNPLTINSSGKVSVSINDLLFGAISKIVNTVALADLELKNNKGKVNNELTDLLEFNINEVQSWFDFIRMMETQRNIKGNAYALILKRDGNLNSLSSDIQAIIPLNPADVVPVYGKKGDEEFYDVAEFGRIPSYNMIHTKHLAFNAVSLNASGANPNDILSKTLKLDSSIKDYSIKTFSRPLYSFLVNTNGVTVSEDEANTLKESIIGFNKGKSSIINDTEALLEVLKNTFNLVEFDKTDKAILGRLGAVYNVPMQLTGALYDYNGIEETLRFFITSTIAPILRDYEYQFNTKILTPAQRKEGYRFKFNTMSLLQGDLKTQSEFYHNALRDGWITRDEVRVKHGFEPLGGNAGILMVPGDMFPIDQDVSERKSYRSNESQNGTKSP